MQRVVQVRSLLGALLGLAAGVMGQSTHAQAWQPAPPLQQVPLWPGTPPDARPTSRPETTGWLGNIDIQDVTQPTLTVYPAKGVNSGAAVIVFPGGGYKILVMDLEGTEVCEWLTVRGITCVLVKYRVPGNEFYPGSGPTRGQASGRRKSGPYPESPLALQDAQRTLGLVRLHAKEWRIDPRKVGVLGFSAGGHLAAAMSTHWPKRVYPPIDAADKESCRPDFAVLVYPGHLWNWTYSDHPTFELNPDLEVTRETPPTFIVQAEDDPVDDVQHSLVYYVALMKAGVPTELHLYATGGHGFGLRRTKEPITAWPELVEVWLRTLGVVPG